MGTGKLVWRYTECGFTGLELCGPQSLLCMVKLPLARFHRLVHMQEMNLWNSNKNDHKAALHIHNNLWIGCPFPNFKAWQTKHHYSAFSSTFWLPTWLHTVLLCHCPSALHPLCSNHSPCWCQATPLPHSILSNTVFPFASVEVLINSLIIWHKIPTLRKTLKCPWKGIYHKLVNVCHQFTEKFRFFATSYTHTHKFKYPDIL